MEKSLKKFGWDWLCVNAELAIGQRKLRGARNLWSKQSLAPPEEDEDVITWLKILVDFPMGSLIGQRDENNNNTWFQQFHYGKNPF